MADPMCMFLYCLFFTYIPPTLGSLNLTSSAAMFEETVTMTETMVTKRVADC